MFTHEELQRCARCSLNETRTHALTGEGNRKANVMLIAQAPGELEDMENRMFIGPSGNILHALLKESNINEDDLYLTNLIKCTLPKNRRPKQREIKACSYYLDQEIEAVQPAIIVPLGFYSTKYLFEKYDLHQFSRKEFSDVIAKSYIIESMTIFPLSHPALLLYNQHFYETSVKNFITLRNLMKAVQ